MLYFERKFKKLGFHGIIGVDEAGRGPLAGPVVASAVMLVSSDLACRIDDSKKLTPRQRDTAFLAITRQSFYGIGVVNEKVIDSLNILSATRIAMEESIEDLMHKLPARYRSNLMVLVDGTVPLTIPFPCTNLIKGDARSMSIAAASIIAKVTRDRIMRIYDEVYPQYGFIRHKGYPTAAHRMAIRQFGQTLIHRKSFCCV